LWESSGEKEIEAARRYVSTLCAGEKEKLRLDILEQVNRRVVEIKEILGFQGIFERESRTRSLPGEESLNKIMKCEAALDRSISRNLFLFQGLQERRYPSPEKASKWVCFGESTFWVFPVSPPYHQDPPWDAVILRTVRQRTVSPTTGSPLA
jgi:hypothetical protein